MNAAVVLIESESEEAFHFSISKHGSNIQSQTNHFFLNVIIGLSGKNLVSENGEREMKISVERDFGEKFEYEDTERVESENSEQHRRREKEKFEVVVFIL
ncbi:hypothetical protein MTR_8g071210 [Medicago truncatula]|uniref:Uncharacterized protein n=1 Tax=Medicago truncatula TaxID=3880 RepID=A0A072TS22_MEDTR|nr:hypothetical protein MTR_8g071210 [Medicago truncatula]